MSGITSAMNTALSGLDLFEAGIETVSNNLTNSTISGYSVESVNAAEVAEGAGKPGAGVTAPVVVRAADSFAASQLYLANSQNAAATNAATQLTNISNALTNNGDVQTAVDQFFNDMSTLAADPTSSGDAETVLADAQEVVSAFQNASGSIQSSIAASSATVTQSVGSANSLLQQLASINQALINSPNDPSLLDQQQAALTSLSSLINVNTIPQPNGTVIVANGGTILLNQSGAQTMTVGQDSQGDTEVTVGNGNVPLKANDEDGSIGNALSTLQAGNAAQQSLNAIATIFAGLVNTAQAQGLTSTGAQGGALFSIPSPTVTASTSNSGTATVSVASVNSSALPSNGGPFTVTYSTSTGWSAVNQATGQAATVTGSPPSFAGITLSVSGAPANGDSWVVNPASGAANSISVTATSSDQIASADPYVGTPGMLQSDGSIKDSNTGVIDTGSDSVVSTPASTAAVVPEQYYGQDLLVTFTSATGYSISTIGSSGTTGPVVATGTFNGATGGEIAVAYPSGSAASGAYWQIPITGTPDAGDTLTLTPGGSSSGSNATRMASLWAASGMTADGTLQQTVIGFSTQLGAAAQLAKDQSTATGDQVTTVTTNLQNVSGVNSDQQAVDLTNYQQAYQAAAQVISTARTMFESLITSVAS